MPVDRNPRVELSPKDGSPQTFNRWIAMRLIAMLLRNQVMPSLPRPTFSMHSSRRSTGIKRVEGVECPSLGTTRPRKYPGGVSGASSGVGFP